MTRDNQILPGVKDGQQSLTAVEEQSDDQRPDDLPRTDHETFTAALETIRAEYGDDYDEWLRFASDATDAARAAGYGVDFHDPNVHMPIVRYQRLDADVVYNMDEISADHAMALVEIADGLGGGRDD